MKATYIMEVYIRYMLIFICKMQDDSEMAGFVSFMVNLQSCR